MTRLRPLLFDVVAMVLFTPPAVVLGVAAKMWFDNVVLPSTVFSDPHIGGTAPCPPGDIDKCPVPMFSPGDLVRVNYTIRRNRACSIKVSRVMEDTSGRYFRREQQVDYTEQTFGAEEVVRPSGYTFKVPEGKPDDLDVRCQRYDVYSRVQYFCNELDRLVPRFMTTDGRPETQRVRIEVCRPETAPP